MTLSNVAPIFRYSEALEAGHTRAELNLALDRGEVHRLCHGWYAVISPRPLLESWQAREADHLDHARLMARRLPGHVVSHTSAALLHGLAVTISASTPVHLTAADGSPTSLWLPGTQIHHSDSIENDCVVIDGLRVTTLDRTIADVLRTRTLPHGVALLDDALRRGVTDLTSVRDVLDTQRRWRGRPRALGAVDLADPTRESWAESFSFAHLHLQGIPIPLHQVEVLDADGRFVARVDGLWPQAGLVGECDGESKYFMDPLAEGEPEETVLAKLAAEAQRQQALESLGLDCVRWTPARLRDHPDKVAGRVNAAFAKARPESFTGWVVWEGVPRRLPFEVPRPQLNLELILTGHRRRRRRQAA